MKRQAQFGPAVPHFAHHGFNLARIGPAHGIRQCQILNDDAGFHRYRQPIRHGCHHLCRRNIACVITAEGRLQPNARYRHAGCDMRRRLLAHGFNLPGAIAVQVLQRKRFRRGKADGPKKMQAILEGKRTIQPRRIEPQRGIVNIGFGREARDHLFRIGPARHKLG